MQSREGTLPIIRMVALTLLIRTRLELKVFAMEAPSSRSVARSALVSSRQNRAHYTNTGESALFFLVLVAFLRVFRSN